MKRAISYLVLAAMLMVTFISLPTAKAAGEPTISAAEVTAQPGETVEMPITMTGNPGVVMMSLSIGYDADVLEFVKNQFGTVISGSSVTTMTSPATANPYKLMWISTATENHTDNGVLSTLTFKVKEDVRADVVTPITITYKSSDITDVDLAPVTFATVDGAVTVKVEEEVPGGDSHDVLGKYVESERVDVYSVDVVWGGMEFDYNAPDQIWNAETHTWDNTTEAEWTVKENSSNEILVTNHSSVAVDVMLTADITAEGVNGEFSATSANIAVPEEGVDGAKSFEATFMLTGELSSAVTDYATVGSITVSID